MSIPVAVRTCVWTSNNPGYTAKCYCCGIQDVSRDNFHAGHVQSRVMGGPTTLDNLKPICAQCNTSMGSNHMWDWAVGHGLKGRIVSERRLVLAPVEIKAQPVCRGCQKPRTAAYLAKHNGWCEACFLVILSVPKEVITLRVPLPSDEKQACPHCAAAVGLGRR